MEQLLIGGEDVIPYIVKGSFNFEEHLYSQIDSLTFTLIDYDGNLPDISRSNRSSVTWILSDGTRRFGGRVVRANKQVRQDGLLRFKILAQDYTIMLHNEADTLARSAFINKIYYGQTSSEIIADATELLGLDLDVTTYVETGKTHERIQSNRLTFAQILDTLVELDDYNYYVDSGPGPNGEIASLHYFEEKLSDANYGLATDPQDVMETERGSWMQLDDIFESGGLLTEIENAGVGTNLSAIIDELMRGQTYEIQVRAKNEIGDGLWSELESITVQ